MRFVIQRVSQASVTIDGDIVGSIGRGYMILIGISETDTEDMAPETFSLTVRTLPDCPKSRVLSAGPFVFPEGDPLRLRSLTLKENLLILEREGSVGEIPFIPGGYLEAPWPGKPEEPAVITAGWTDPGQLRLRCHAVGVSPCGFEMLLCLKGDTATVQCFRSHDPLTDDYDGVTTGRIKE